MKVILSVLLFNLLALPFVLAASPEDLEIRDAYVRGLPPGVPNTAAYMTLSNVSEQALVLTGASTAVAESVSVHESFQENGQQFMRHLEGVAIPAGGELVLESGGKHLMLTNLRGALKAGDSIELTLLFKDGLEKTLSLPVRSVLTEQHHGH